MKKTVLLLLLLLSSFAQANFTDENLCQQLDQFKQDNKEQFEEIKKLKKELVFSQLFPKKYFELHIDKNSIDEDTNTETVKGNGIILSIGNPDVEKNAQKIFKSLLKKYKKQNKVFLKLMKKDSIEKCQKTKAKLGFDYNDYLKSKEELSGYKEFTRWQEYKSVRKASRRFLKQRKVKWNIKYGVVKRDIVEALSSGKYKHIVLVMHAKDNGFLIDSNSVILPTRLFKNPHPNIESLLLMSCYSDKVIKKYHLKDDFLKANRNVKYRTLMTPLSKLTIQDNRSILKVLKFYLKSYKKNVLKSSNFKLKNEIEVKKCTFRLKSTLKGGIDLFASDKFYLGEFINDTNEIKTNCINLEGAKYISVRPHTHQPPQFEELEISGLKLKRHFYFDGKYSGSSFELINKQH